MTSHLSANKVPAVSLVFWGIKILSTTVGETGADYLAVHVGGSVTVTTLVTAALLALVLALQMTARTLIDWRYWSTVVLLSVVGTQITDLLTDKLKVSLYWSTLAFAVALLVTFGVWYGRERTLSIKAIDSLPRESFYWLAILFTFALGTAAGDLATEALGLGFTLGVVVFAALIAACAVAWWLGADAVLMFWIAYILTRPLGASLGDLLSHAREYGGAGFGTSVTSLIFFAVIVTLVVFTSVKRSASAFSKSSNGGKNAQA